MLIGILLKFIFTFKNKKMEQFLLKILILLDNKFILSKAHLEVQFILLSFIKSNMYDKII
jgi:hypothetical protein